MIQGFCNLAGKDPGQETREKHAQKGEPSDLIHQHTDLRSEGFVGESHDNGEFMASPLLDVRRYNFQRAFFFGSQIALAQLESPDGIEVVRIVDRLLRFLDSWNKMAPHQAIRIKQDSTADIHDHDLGDIRLGSQKVAKKFPEFEIAGIEIRVITVANGLNGQFCKREGAVLHVILKFLVLKVDEENRVDQQNDCYEEAEDQG